MCVWVCVCARILFVHVSLYAVSLTLSCSKSPHFVCKRIAFAQLYAVRVPGDDLLGLRKTKHFSLAHCLPFVCARAYLGCTYELVYVYLCGFAQLNHHSLSSLLSLTAEAVSLVSQAVFATEGDSINMNMNMNISPYNTPSPSSAPSSPSRRPENTHNKGGGATSSWWETLIPGLGRGKGILGTSVLPPVSPRHSPCSAQQQQQKIFRLGAWEDEEEEEEVDDITYLGRCFAY